MGLLAVFIGIIFALLQFFIHHFERYALSLSMERRELLNHCSLKPQEPYRYEYEP